jgi:hypothetical protein
MGALNNSSIIVAESRQAKAYRTPGHHMKQTKSGPRMSDEAVAAKTGKNWKQWFAIIDKAGGKKMTHQEIVKLPQLQTQRGSMVGPNGDRYLRTANWFAPEP